MVPEGWKLVTLGEVIHESAFGPRFSAELYSDNGNVGTIRTTDLDSEGNINYKTIPYANLPDSFEAHYLKNNDLLITRSGTCGIPCLFEKQDKPIIAGAFLIRFILKDNVHPKYIHSLLKSEHLQRDIHNLSSGGVQKNLSGTNLKKLKFILPPLLEQKKIAQIISTWDMAIVNTERLLSNIQQQKKALTQKIFTGKNRFSEFNEIWKSYKLSDLAMVQMGSSPKSEAYNESGDGLPLIQGNADIKNRRSAPRIFTAEITKECDVGDILLSVRAPVGTVALSSHKACIGRGISAIRANVGVSQDFLYQWFLWFEPRWGALSQGSTFESINSDDIKHLKIELPGLEEQKKIALSLFNVDQEIGLLQLNLSYLKQEKKALMQQLLTGKRRVKVDAA